MLYTAAFIDERIFFETWQAYVTDTFQGNF